MTVAGSAPAHGLARRLITRCALIAFALYHLPLLINDYPSFGGGGASERGLSVAWGHIFGQVGLWIASHVLAFAHPELWALTGDNGDTPEEYSRALLGIVLGVLGAALWTFADRRRPGGRWVERALHILLRYAIALGLASYAVAKLLPIQFSPIDHAEMDARLGELTPMHMMWSFMETSRVYSTFAGVMEMVVVLLVAFRRTATAGALLCMVVVGNVVLLDVCYGVPVRLFSASLVVSAAALVAFDARRLVAVVTHHPVPPPVPPDPLFQAPILRGLGWLAKIVLIGGVIVSSFVQMLGTQDNMLPVTPPALRGTWDVASFTLAGRELAGTGDPARWRRVAIGDYSMVVRLETDDTVRCSFAPGVAGAAEPAGQATLDCGKRHKGGPVRWTRTGDQLALDGTFDGAAFTARLTRHAAMALEGDVFRWVLD